MGVRAALRPVRGPARDDRRQPRLRPHDWYDRLTEDPHGERVWAWGRQMTLDTTYSVAPATSTPPRLAELRKAILGAYIAAGPIFA